jgi:Ca2+-binding EF-hand superfamily protein
MKVSLKIQITNTSDMDPNIENNIYNLYSEEEIENFRCIFEMFDKEKSGFIDVSDL